MTDPFPEKLKIHVEKERIVAEMRRSRGQAVKCPSPRQPHRSTMLNRADITERLLRKDGHRLWGYVIYRTNYSSERDWNEFLRRMKLVTQYAFDRCNGRDIFDDLAWTVFDDSVLFADADTAAIRSHFEIWAEDAWRAEQQPNNNSAASETKLPLYMGYNPRYHFCILADKEVLRSVVHESSWPPTPDGRG